MHVLELPLVRPHHLLRFVVRHWVPICAVVLTLGAADASFFHERMAIDWRNFWSDLLPSGRSGLVPEDEGTYDVRHFHPSPPAVEPPTISAAEATIPEDERVLGVSAGGKHRAYRLAALAGDMSHVVNDTLGGVAVTVTYCDLADCARAYTGAGRTRPLEITQVGFREGRFVIASGNYSYYQDNQAPVGRTAQPAFPFAEHPVSRMTWKEWKARYRDTDLSAGSSL